MPNVPNSNQPGLFLAAKGSGQNDSRWSVLPYEDRTYSLSGTLGLPSGATNFLPPFFKSVAPGNSVSLIAIRCVLRAGTATFSINQNGTAVPGLSAVSVTTTASYVTPTVAVNVVDGDLFAPVCTAVSGADGLSLTFIFATGG